MTARMSGAARRAQVLDIAAREFAAHGLHGASTDAIAKEAGITQAYVFRMFGTKKALFLELVREAFGSLCNAMRDAGEQKTGIDALSAMGSQYFDRLSDQTALLLQLQGFAACGDPEVRETVRAGFAQLWDTTQRGTGLEPLTVKAFLAFGTLLNAGAAMDVEQVDEPWADGIRTRVRSGLFAHITSETNH
ncbi:TetR/AcrR family transcriptional regulator [Tsukamurella sp. 8F]|uniref:TetR/AcrR family transcriptional regulator n=1 Tax=unclassified Tsukamurella TaxID=2633480 RepID=UPI0023B8F1AF|nr:MULTISPECIES: TetR/AcrR family transcriptional regulator [unclassified Tsukamurella]MDF0532335.1 TetR/AcrR family transcriptional regulator [Tsukamurella sp. 8J]MDF0589453.1 TetR/AcrR family transcriptional regulator [Tsukamurella sp. 8F]